MDKQINLLIVFYDLGGRQKFENAIRLFLMFLLECSSMILDPGFMFSLFISLLILVWNSRQKIENPGFVSCVQ